MYIKNILLSSELLMKISLQNDIFIIQLNIPKKYTDRYKMIQMEQVNFPFGYP